jgi:hypothetical protein
MLPAWKRLTKLQKGIATDLSRIGLLFFQLIFIVKLQKTMLGQVKIRFYKTNYKEYQKKISLALEQLKAGQF